MPIKLFNLSNNLRTWLIYVLLIIIVSGFVFGSLIELPLDTHEDEIFRDHLAADGLLYFFQPAEQKEFSAPGRPITEIFRYFGYLIWGNDAGNFHLYCAAVHTLASLLLALMVRRLGMPLDLSLVAGLLFLLNVSHFRGVHYISGLDYPLAQVWSLAAVLAYVRFVEVRHWLWLLVAGACLALGTASHQASVMVLPFLFCWSWVRGETLRQMLPPMAILGALLALEMHLLLQITDVDGATTSVSLRQLLIDSPLTTIPAVVRVLLWLVGRLFTTAHWIFFPLYQLQSWEYYFGGLALLGLAALAYYRMRYMAIWSAWTVLSLVPFILVSEEIHLHLVHGPSRHLYMASAGSSVLLAWGLQQVGRALVQRLTVWGYIAYGLALIAVCLSGYANLKRTEALSHYATGRFYIMAGDTEMGIKQLQNAIAKGHDIIPLIDAYQRIGLVSLSQLNDAALNIENGLKYYPNDKVLNIYKLVLSSVDSDSANRHIARNKLSTITDNHNNGITAQGFYNVGNGLSKKGDITMAIDAYKQSLYYSPNTPNSLKALSRSLLQQGRLKEAIHSLELLVDTDSTDYKMYYVLGKLYATQRDNVRAAQTLSFVQKIAPHSEEATKAREILSKID